MTEPSSETRQPAVDRKSRRWIAILLSLDTPGLGHLVVGHPRKMVAWCAVGVGLTVLAVIAILTGAFRLMFACLGVGLALRIAAAVDTLRLPRRAPLPRGGAVVLIIVGLLTFTQILAWRVRAGLVEAFKIPSGSMVPTLLVGDHVFATKWDLTPARGDVVVHRHPEEPHATYIKRVVALAGDRVEIREGILFVNEVAVPREPAGETCQPDESGETCSSLWTEHLGDRAYLVQTTHGRRPASFDPITVPPDSVFVLGDNRDNSSDSRAFGPLPTNLLVGKASAIWWSSDEHGSVRWDRVNLRVR